MLSCLPANMKLRFWSCASKSVTSFEPSMLLKFLMTALRMTPPFVSSVNCNLSFFSTTCCEVPLRAERKRAVVSTAELSATVACCFAARAASSWAFLACSFMTVSIESCFLAASICSAEGWFHQLNPISTIAIRTKPIMVSLFIAFFIFLHFKVQRYKI